jgi:hypothetical protein
VDGGGVSSFGNRNIAFGRKKVSSYWCLNRPGS